MAIWERPEFTSGAGQVMGGQIQPDLAILTIHTGLVTFNWAHNLKCMTFPGAWIYLHSSNAPYDVSREAITRSALNFPSIKWFYFLDSVPNYTPIIVRDPVTKNINILPISELGIFNEIGLERVNPIYPYEVLDSGDRWCKINKVIRHPFNGYLKKINCQMGVIDITKNHSIYRNNNKENLVDVNDLKIGDQLIFPRFFHGRDTDRGFFFPGDEDLAWLYGFFVAEGSVASDMLHISISNKDEQKLQKAKDIFESNYTIKMCFIDSQKDKVSKIEITNKRLAYFLNSSFYTDARDKKIPSTILNAPEKIILSFLQGFLDGDGHINRNGTKYYQNNSQIVMQGILFLLRRLRKNYSVFVREDKPKAISIAENVRGDQWYIEKIQLWEKAMKLREEKRWGARKISRELTINENTVKGWLGKGLKPQRRTIPSEIKKTFDVPYKGYVYDLATETHRFTAGVGPLLVHNSDTCPPLDCVPAMMKLAEDNKIDVLSGLYWARKHDCNVPCAWRKIGEDKEKNQIQYGSINIDQYLNKNALIPVDVAGCGCLLIRPDVFRRLDQSNPKKPFFQWGVGRKYDTTGEPLLQLSEDFYLFNRIQEELKIQPYLTTAVKCNHICMTQKRGQDGAFELI